MGLRPAIPSSLPTSARSSCQMAMWPTWANWRPAPTLMPPWDPRGPPWPRAAMAGLPLWTSSENRASCFARGAPARQSGRAQGRRPPPWHEARPEASASSWTAKSEAQTVAGLGSFAHTLERPTWPHVEGWAPGPTSCISVCPSVLVPFPVGGPSPGGGRREQQGPRGFSSVCKSMKINTTCVPPDCPPAWHHRAAQPPVSSSREMLKGKEESGCAQGHAAGQRTGSRLRPGEPAYPRPPLTTQAGLSVPRGRTWLLIGTSACIS